MWSPEGQRPPAPGSVQTAAILLYVGGGVTVVVALTEMSGTLLRAGAYVLLGLLFLGLARGVKNGRQWARRTVLVLCAVGVVLAGVRLIAGSGISAAIGALVWPVVYAILLSTASARAWFRDQSALS